MTWNMPDLQSTTSHSSPLWMVEGDGADDDHVDLATFLKDDQIYL